MDTLTHALSGALLARATAKSTAGASEVSLRQRVAMGAAAAAFPDIDIVFTLISPLTYLYNHRGITHSLVILPLWAPLLGALFAWLIDHNLSRWRACSLVAGLSIAIHIVGDLITSFGTIIFAPFSDARYAWSTTFIIDPWFTGIILLALAASWAWRRARIPAVAGCVVLVGYVMFQYMLQQRAIEFGERYALARGMANVEVSASPRPVSPFNWMVVVRDAERYHYSNISLSRNTVPPPLPPGAGFIERLGAAYLPLEHAQWKQVSRYGESARDRQLALDAWQHPRFEFFRWFAEYPALYRIDRGNPSECVWFEDLRFLTPGRDRIPFRQGMCREQTGPWTPYSLVGDTGRAVLE